MKLTKQVIKEFELEQKEFGTEVALSNFITLIAFELLKGLGYTGIKLQKEKK